jgi:hypothetical protein
MSTKPYAHLSKIDNMKQSVNYSNSTYYEIFTKTLSHLFYNQLLKRLHKVFSIGKQSDNNNQTLVLFGK